MDQLKPTTMFLDGQYMFPTFQQQFLNGNATTAASMLNLNGAAAMTAGGDETLISLGGNTQLTSAMKKPLNGQQSLGALHHNNNNETSMGGGGHRSLAAIDDDRVKRPMNAFMVS
jgi:hypothetical protein